MYAWAFRMVTRVVVVQLVTISASLNCVNQDGILVRPYDDSLLGRLELIISIS